MRETKPAALAPGFFFSSCALDAPLRASAASRRVAPGLHDHEIVAVYQLGLEHVA